MSSVVPEFNVKRFNSVLKSEIDSHSNPSEAVKNMFKKSSMKMTMTKTYEDILPKLKNLTTYDVYCYRLFELLLENDNKLDNVSDLLRDDIVRTANLYVKGKFVETQVDTLNDGLKNIFISLYEAVRGSSEISHTKTPQEIENIVYALIIKISIFLNPRIFGIFFHPISLDKFYLREYEDSDIETVQNGIAKLNFQYELTYENTFFVAFDVTGSHVPGDPFKIKINYGCILDDKYMRETKLTDLFTLLMSNIEKLYTKDETADMRILKLEQSIGDIQEETSHLEELNVLKRHLSNTKRESQLPFVPFASSPAILKSKPPLPLPLHYKLQNLISEAIKKSLTRRISNIGGGRKKYFSRKQKSSHNKSRINKTRRFC
jgi:hypothetical protein